MRETRYYKVAEHQFCISGEAEVFPLMSNYEPFYCDNISAHEITFALSVESGEAPEYTEELRQEDESLRVGEHNSGLGQEIICGKTANDMPVFEFRWWKQTAGYLVCAPDYNEGQIITTGRYTKMAIDNALMVLFALATANKGTVLFHAAVVSHKGKGYMFLGPSGTGKSTHARLWLNYIEGTSLMNDDNPVVRIGDDGLAVVYGSPWSGKTPCYRNVHCPLGGIVMLSQAPYNKIHRLNGIHAYAVLVSSISGKRWDTKIADGLHQTENALASEVPTWHLECLPDKEAAQMCMSAVTS